MLEAIQIPPFPYIYHAFMVVTRRTIWLVRATWGLTMMVPIVRSRVGRWKIWSVDDGLCRIDGKQRSDRRVSRLDGEKEGEGVEKELQKWE